MKIGLFSDTFYPEVNGVATSCLNLQRELSKRGHEVHVFAPKCKGWREYGNEYFHYINSVPLLALKDRNIALPGYASLSGALDLKLDVVHTNSEFFVGVFGTAIAKLSGCAKVHTYHTIWADYTYYITHGIADKTAQKIMEKYSGWWCEKFDRVIAPSGKTERLLRKYGVMSPIDIIPSGMDITRFAPEKHSRQEIDEIRRECGVQDGERVLINIGRIAREKNLEQVLRVFPALLERFPDVRFVIVGEGPMREELEKSAEKSGVGEKVNFIGSRSWETIDKYYAIGDVFVSASHSETQGLTYIEAMASGLCVCAVDDPCLEDVIVDGVSGILSGSGDEELLDSLIRAFGDDGKRIAAEAPKHTKKFTLETFADNVERTYLEAIEAHNKN